MSLLWRAGKPLTRGDILDGTPDRSWKPNSIHIILNSMLNKNAIAVDGYARSGKNFGRTYIPAVTRSEYQAMKLKKTVSEGQEASSIPGIVAALICNREISTEILMEIKAIVEKRIEENED